MKGLFRQAVRPAALLAGRLRGLSLPAQRWFAAGLILAGGVALVPWPRSGEPRYQVGMVQPKTIIAEFDFPILKDEAQLAREVADRARSVPAVMSRADTATTAAYARLASLRQQVRSLRPGRRGGQDAGQVTLPFSQETIIALLVESGHEAIFDEATALLQDVMRRGFVSAEVAAQLADYREVRIHDALGDVTLPVEQLLNATRVRELAAARGAARDVPPAALAEIVLACARANLVFEPGSTAELLERVREAVEPASGFVLEGEKIIGAHERITAERLRVLESYQHWRGERGVRETVFSAVLPGLGRILVLVLILAIFIGYLRLNRPEVLTSPQDLWLLTAIELLILVVGAVFIRVLQLPPVLVPVAAVSILVTLLFDHRLALAASALPVIVIGMVGDGGSQFLAVVGVGAVTTVLLTHALRQRAQFWRVMALVPLVHLAMLGALAMSDLIGQAGLLREAMAVAANPLLAAALALVVLPYAESISGRSTDITLREFQDLNRPLLRRLMLAAPGTYHHSILVGSMAEAAALSVGANPILARVIGYYHDIGKVAKPEYFQENLGLGMKNPHDRLTPSMSRLILESHVREGLALAREEKLPREIVQGIREHHGVSLMLTAWRKARRQDESARREDYCYPGPRPSCPESALVLLADQVETAARSLEVPTPSRIKGLVQRVVQENLEDGNLEECGLTLRDLGRVRDAYVPMLAAAFRGRIQGEKPFEDETRGETGSRRPALPRNPR